MSERLNGGCSPRLDRGDKKLLWLLTLVYTVVTLLNLGTLRFPQTVWTPPAGESVRVTFAAPSDVASIWFNANIGDGKLIFTADDGATYEYSQAYGEMFGWKKKSVSFSGVSELTLTVSESGVSLNELAFFDSDGNRLDASVTESAAALLDEQDTVPAEPGYFNSMYFDEIYHARTAYEFIHGMSIYEWTHPPLGKLIIAVGVLIFGMCPFGWRVMPALFGAAMLPVMFVLAKRLFRRRDYALLATGLFALDTMHFAQTRIATVDVFVVFFILLMYLFLYDYLQVDFFAAPLRKAFLPLGACGVAFGLGAASKWTGLYAGAGLAVLFFASLVRHGLEARGDAALRRIFWRRTLWTLLFCCGVFLLIPGCIYFAAYTPFYLYDAGKAESYGLRDAFKTLVAQQESMYHYHSTLKATHLCQSAWYQWPFTAKSVWFFFAGGDTVSNISSTGNPAVWWVSSVGTLCLIVELIAGRMKNSPAKKSGAAALLLVAVAANYFPWMLVTRCTFQYHFFPTVPFVILAACLLLQHLEEENPRLRRAKWIWLGAAGVYFLLLFPAVSGLPMPKLYAEFLEYVLPCGLLFHGAV